MSPIFPELPRTLGVYTLTHLLETRENTELYLARQTHVDRAVVLEVLQPDAPHAEEVAFLSKARHLVTTHDVPHVVDVLESLRAEGIWFLTQECPQGCSLDDMAARNIKLPVMSICRVVSSAAEMYETYLEAGHHAMPLAPASVYVEESGEVHFLSPLAEGIPNKPRRQMRALARALKAVCPVIQTPGLGRVTTLLHWLREGVDGEFLTWPEVKETADTIIDQLENNTLPESRKSLLTRLGERIGRLPGARCVQAFMGEWGSRLAAAAATIVLLSCIGLQFGMDAPTHAPACNETEVYCQLGDTCVRVMRQPVSVQQYGDFMLSIKAMNNEQRKQLFQGMPEEDFSLAPLRWEEQLAASTPDAPVTGVSYWQALLCARAAGGHLPTAEVQQLLRTLQVHTATQEWTSTEMESPLPAIYTSPVFLMVSEDGKVILTSNRNEQPARCGFRISYP